MIPLSTTGDGGGGVPLPVSCGMELKREAGTDLAEVRNFSLHWSRTQLAVRAYFTSLFGDPSVIDDCLQEVALVAWRKAPKNATPEVFMAYSLACARRIGLAEIRKKYHNRISLLAPDVAMALADAAAMEEQLEPAGASERISALGQCMQSLKEDHRHLLELRYFSESPDALKREAEVSKRSLDSLYKRLERLRGFLRNCVENKIAASE